MLLVRVHRRFDVYVGAGQHLVALGILLNKVGIVNRVVGFWMDYWPERYGPGILSRLYRNLNSYCVTHVHHLLVVSPEIPRALAEQGMKLGPERVILLPHLIDASDVGVLPQDQLEPNSLLWTGSAADEYGFDLLIDAMELVVGERPNAFVDITSYGKFPRHLRLAIEERGLERHFRVIGFIEDEVEFRDFVRKHRVGLAPYRPSVSSFKKYADPSRLKHYMANGVPPIVTRVPLVAREIDEVGAGKVIDFDRGQLAAAILRLLSDDQFHERCRRNGLELIKRYETVSVCRDVFTSLGMSCDIGPASEKESHGIQTGAAS
jgi:glycosyltransferase involved in cell wall biosynthesis